MPKELTARKWCKLEKVATHLRRFGTYEDLNDQHDGLIPLAKTMEWHCSVCKVDVLPDLHVCHQCFRSAVFFTPFTSGVLPQVRCICKGHTEVAGSGSACVTRISEADAVSALDVLNHAQTIRLALKIAFDLPEPAEEAPLPATQADSPLVTQAV